MILAIEMSQFDVIMIKGIDNYSPTGKPTNARILFLNNLHCSKYSIIH